MISLMSCNYYPYYQIVESKSDLVHFECIDYSIEYSTEETNTTIDQCIDSNSITDYHKQAIQYRLVIQYTMAIHHKQAIQYRLAIQYTMVIHHKQVTLYILVSLFPRMI